MLKINTEGEYAEIQVKGDAQEIGKELLSVTASIATTIAKSGAMGKIQAIVMMKAVGTALCDDEFIHAVVEEGLLEDGISSTEPMDDESDEDTRARSLVEAMKKFTKARPIKVDENYNVIEESEDEE